MKKRFLFIFTVIVILCFTGCSRSNTNINKYLNTGKKINTHAKNFMPAIEDLPDHKDISYKYNNYSVVFFETDTITLKVDYDEEIYEKEKEKLTQNYKFLNKKVISKFDESKYYIPEYEFSINSYSFRIVDEKDNYTAKYPKSFGIIGTSDEKKSIVYLYFYDEDLDYIEEDNKGTMSNFVKKFFKFDY